MARSTLTRATPRAINETLTLLNVERMLFCLILVICFFIAWAGKTMVAWAGSTGLFLAACLYAQYLTRTDESYLEVLRSSWDFPVALDPFEREPFSLVIVEDR